MGKWVYQFSFTSGNCFSYIFHLVHLNQVTDGQEVCCAVNDRILSMFGTQILERLMINRGLIEHKMSGKFSQTPLNAPMPTTDRLLPFDDLFGTEIESVLEHDC